MAKPTGIDRMGANEDTVRRGLQRDLPSRLKLSEIRRAMGPAPDLTCLDIGADLPYLIRGLRARGGAWSSVLLDGTSPEDAGFLPEENVTAYAGPGLPFEDKTFDVVVLVDALVRIVDDRAFVQECHRVLKTGGRIVIVCHRPKTFSLNNVFRRLFHATPESLGWARGGYTEKELFGLLKAGFNVTRLRTHTRLLVALVESIVRGRQAGSRRAPDSMRLAQLRSRMAALYRLAYQFDTLFLLTKGHGWIAVGHRRTWRSRQPPVLSDGRTITEAVLSRPAV